MSDLSGIKQNLFTQGTPEPVRSICQTMKNAGFQIYIVGGAIRNLIHNRLYNNNEQVDTDFDFATDATPEQVMNLFAKQRVVTIPTGLKHGTVSIVIDHQNYEITTFRVDSDYADGRHPDKVSFTPSLLEDLKRRDFTINAIAYDIFTEELFDPFNGIDDIRAKTIRAVGNPLTRFLEDGLRPIRACRFAAALDYAIDPPTFAAISEAIHIVKMVSPERVHDELMKLMKTPVPSVGLDYLRHSGILALFLPELIEGVETTQNEFHKYDVYYHNVYTCNAVPRNKPLLRFAALFHDLGKPRAKEYAIRNGNGNVFYNHEVISAKMTEKILKRLKFSNQSLQYIVLMVQMHMFYYTEEWTDGAVRRFLRKIDGNLELLGDLFLLRKADRIGSGMRTGDAEILDRFYERIQRILEADNALKVTDLDIDGNIVMQAYGIKPGPMIGKILNAMLDKVLDNPELNTREQLIRIGLEYIQNPTPEQPEEDESYLI